MHKRILCALAIIVAGAAAAQNAPQADPRDPKAPVPPVEYRSAFEGYQPYKEPELASWREANERVRRVDKPTPKPPMHGMQQK